VIILFQPQVDQVSGHHHRFHRDVPFDQAIDVEFVNLDVLHLQAHEQFNQVFLILEAVQEFIARFEPYKIGQVVKRGLSKLTVKGHQPKKPPQGVACDLLARFREYGLA
jgi:hypothetical protein